MIVDDSLVARTILSRAIEANNAFELVAAASSADHALALLPHHSVDIILLDVQMPGTDGLTALPDLIGRSGGAKVLIVSSSCTAGAAASVRALTLGAADTLFKPAAGSLAGEFERQLVERLLRIGQRIRALPSWARPAALGGAPSAAGPVACLAIGASTGGPHALAVLLKALPKALPVPILITQHLPASFIPYFAEQLREISGRRCSVATEGMELRPGEILLAPGDAHMRVARNCGVVRVRLDRGSSISGCLPSVDPMMESVGMVFGGSAIAVMLTGMGRDGLAGARVVRNEGGEVIAQDAETSVVWGMPGAVAEAGVSSAVLPPARIAHRVANRLGRCAWN